MRGQLLILTKRNNGPVNASVGEGRRRGKEAAKGIEKIYKKKKETKCSSARCAMDEASEQNERNEQGYRGR